MPACKEQPPPSPSTLFPGELAALLKGWKRITVVGNTYLDGVPLECLTPPGSEQALGLSHALDSAPSLGMWAAWSERGKEAKPSGETPATPHLIAGVTLRSDSEALALSPYALPVDGQAEEQAVQRLVRNWPGSHQALPGLDWGTFREACRTAPPQSIAHLVAHGGFDGQRERGACLLLAPQDDWPAGVYCEDIEALEGVPPVILLSTCAAARGPLRRGDDVLGNLGGAFLAAGARCVILTRASITLEHSLELAEELQAGLAAGLGPAEALRRARVRLASSGGGLAPYRLGRMQAVGAGGRSL